MVLKKWHSDAVTSQSLSMSSGVRSAPLVLHSFRSLLRFMSLASTDSDARTIARSVAASSLFKAAVFGRDPNWGRIACAAGYAGVEFDQSALRISLGPHALMEAGQPLEFDEKAASGYLKAAGDVRGTVVVDISVGSGQGSGVAFGCDLSYDYVEINAEYTT